MYVIISEQKAPDFATHFLAGFSSICLYCPVEKNVLVDLVLRTITDAAVETQFVVYHWSNNWRLVYVCYMPRFAISG